MSTLKIWLIRHGESSANAGLWTVNPAEVELTALGRTQAAQIARHITQSPYLLVVSPLLRAQQTAEFILNRWPETETQIWPVQEWIYLSPSRLKNLSPEARKAAIHAYWENSDPLYCDGEDAESFDSFLKRVFQCLEDLHKQQGFIVLVGHGQFIKACQLASTQGLEATAEQMRLFRQSELNAPVKNGEICQID